MKKIILLILALICIVVFNSKGQVKPKEEKSKYKKVVVVEVQDFQNLIKALSSWKELSIFDPNTTSEEKVKLYKDLSIYSKDLIDNRIKLDSVIVKP